ncbi:hypothetical protein Tco_0473117 [Tanacetum coccineum]
MILKIVSAYSLDTTTPGFRYCYFGFIQVKVVLSFKRDVEFKQYEINNLKAEKLKQEKDAIDFKIEKFDKASNDLDQLLGSQITDKSKQGFGYSAEFQQPEFEVYGLRANKSVCENSLNETKKNSDAPLIEEWVSDNEDEVESLVVVEKKTVIPTIPKVDVVRPKQQENPVRKTVRIYSVNQENVNELKNIVLMKTGMRLVNAAEPKAAYNAVKEEYV